MANNLNSVRFDASLTQVAWTLTLRWRVLIGQYQVTWPYYTRKPHTRANRDTGNKFGCSSLDCFDSMDMRVRWWRRNKNITWYKLSSSCSDSTRVGYIVNNWHWLDSRISCQDKSVLIIIQVYFLFDLDEQSVRQFLWVPGWCKNLSGREKISASRDFTICIIRCVYRAEFILGR